MKHIFSTVAMTFVITPTVDPYRDGVMGFVIVLFVVSVAAGVVDFWKSK